jgi:PKD repeat protein
VALTVTTLDGPVIETKNNYITVKNDPRVDAKAIFSNYGNNIFRFYSENGSNYTNKWFYNNDNDSLTADTIYLTFPSPGNYTVKLKASNACNDTTITINLTDWTDVVELKNTRIDVYPNPATSSIKINTQEHRFETVRILDLSGRVVLNQAFKANHNIDISTLQKGMYILQLQFNNTLISTKLIKE